MSGTSDSDDSLGAETVSLTGAVAAPRRVLKSGESVGRYVILGRIGEGGMGIVYKAYDPELERPVALKFLHAAGGDDSLGSTRRERLMREGKALARLSHPNVLAVYDVGTYGGDVFVATEFLDGMTLRAWLDVERRSTAEILGVLAEAGEGLAAAHRADIVHRDFKPMNVVVIVDADKGPRVRVLDFGLARAGAAERLSDPPHPSLRSPSAKRDAPPPASARTALPDEQDDAEDAPRSFPMDSPLTYFGEVLGTPRYMAPEQHVGQSVDARSDQFSFAVTLYEALYRELPFERGDDTYRESVTKGRFKPPPEGASVPRWLRPILLRAMSPSAADRYPSMDALLAALRADPRVARRRWIAAATGVLLVAALGFGYARARRSASNVCGGASSKLAGVWDDDRRKSVAAAFAATEAPFAAHAAADVAAELDAYALAWAAMHTESCEATRVRGEQSAELLDLRMACLEQRRQDLAAQVAVFSRAEPSTVENAARAARTLPRLDACADVAALRAPVPPPTEPAAKEQVRAAKERLAVAGALQRSGAYARGLDEAEAAAELASRAGFRPLEAEALFLVGDLEDDTGAYKAAERTLHRAVGAAIAGRQEVFLARALTALVAVVGLRQARFDEGHEWRVMAEAAVERGDPYVRGELARNAGRLFYRQGKFDESRASIEKCLALWEPALGSTHLSMAGPLTDLGNVFFSVGNYDEAIARYQRSLDILERVLGPSHPYLAPNLNNLGEIYAKQGDYARSLVTLERVQRLWEAAFGPEHPKVGLVVHNLGVTLLDSGDARRAQPYAERAVAIYEKALGPDHPDVAMAETGLANVLHARGEDARAVALYERALAVREARFGRDHAEVAATLTGLGEARLASGDANGARAVLERALAIQEKGGEKGSGDAFDLATTRFAAARALVRDSGARARAIELAVKSRDAFAALGARARPRVVEVDAWLAKTR